MERFGKRSKRRHRSKKPELERSKLDMEIAKYLRFNVPRKSTMMQKQAVEYFVGSKAVDVLMESKWAIRKKGMEQYFVGREDATAFLDELLQKNFFYRVMKNEHEPKKKDKKDDEKKEDSDRKSQNEEQDGITEISTKLRKRKNKNIDVEVNGEKPKDSESSKTKGKTKDKKKTDDKSKEKVKKRYKLTYHEEQAFLDSKDIYIWVYNPVSWKTIVKGVGVMLLVAVATLFPLWPDEVRVVVYYLSVTAGSFIGSVFVVAFLRTLLFGVIWVLTGGSHHFWVLPNLLEDVGFLESFKPMYSYEYKGSTKEGDDEEEESDQDDDDSDDGEEHGDGDQGDKAKMSVPSGDYVEDE